MLKPCLAWGLRFGAEGKAFYGKYLFKADISGWKTGQVTDMKKMFHRAYAFNADLSDWDTSKVRNSLTPNTKWGLRAPRRLIVCPSVCLSARKRSQRSSRFKY